jgi:chromosome segregation ATPase
MSDNNPNYTVEQQKLQVNIVDQQAAIARLKLEVLELADRIEKNKENIAATHKGIADLNKEITTSASPLEKQRKRSQLAHLNANIERQTLENLEMAERVSTSADRATSTWKALESFLQNAKQMEEAHGKITDKSIAVLAKECLDSVEGITVT